YNVIVYRIFDWSVAFMNTTAKSGAPGGDSGAGRSSLVPYLSPAEIDRALLDAQFSLVYQPMIDLRTGRITACEALLRWHHPVIGVILPGVFVDLIEEAGFMPRLGRWVLHTALAEAARWPDGIRVAVNVAAAQFLTGDLAPVVGDALTATKLDPN